MTEEELTFDTANLFDEKPTTPEHFLFAKSDPASFIPKLDIEQIEDGEKIWTFEDLSNEEFELISFSSFSLLLF